MATDSRPIQIAGQYAAPTGTDDAQLGFKPIAMTVEQFCDTLQIGKTAAFAILKRNEISSFTVGRARRILVADVERYVAERLARAGR